MNTYTVLDINGILIMSDMQNMYGIAQQLTCKCL